VLECHGVAIMVGEVMTDNSTKVANTGSFSKTVKGTVVDENGIPIIGANIVVAGTTHGTVTDIGLLFFVYHNRRLQLRLNSASLLLRRFCTPNFG